MLFYENVFWVEIILIPNLVLNEESCGGASARVIKLDVVGAGPSGARAVENDFSKAKDLDGERRRNLAAAVRNTATMYLYFLGLWDKQGIVCYCHAIVEKSPETYT